MQYTLPCLARRHNYLQMLVLLAFLLLTLREQSAAPVTMAEKSTKSTYNNRFTYKTCSDSEIASRRFPRQWPLILLRLQVLNRLLAASQPSFPPRKQVQLPPQAAPARQDLGTHLDNLMVPKATGSLGSPRTTTETQDADLILSQALRMNVHEVSSYYSFHVNNSTLECLFRLMKSGKGQTYQLSTGPSEFIATQVPHPPNSYSKQEPNVNTLRPGTRMTYPLRS